MPSSTRSLTLRTARDLISKRGFPAVTRDRVGLELEWLTRSPGSPASLQELQRIVASAEPLPFKSAITWEPGGQVEISTRPFDTCALATAAACADSNAVRSALSSAGVQTVGLGLDPARSEDLVTSQDRYVAMRSFFDERGPAGGRMMCTTAAVHVNVDAGSDEEGARRWRLAHRLGPLFVAAFSNSPLVYGRPSGWKSARFSAWIDIDPSRTGPAFRGGRGPDDWSSYALASNVMFIRAPTGYVSMPTDISFAHWVEEGHELGYPTEDDLDYHLTTLFPPVRPHGRLELRMIDMLPEPWWRAPVVIATALLTDERAGAEAWDSTKATKDLWTEAARHGLDHPGLRDVAQRTFRAALDAVGRIACDGESVRTAETYFERFVERGRSPADDRLTEFATDGRLYPADETVEAA